LDINLEKTGKTEALIKISLKQQDYQPAVDEKIKDYSKKANIKGFRAGKVPTGVIRKMFGKSLLVDEVNHMVSHKLMHYLRESDMQFLGEPIPNHDRSASIDWESQKDFDFEFRIGFANEFELRLDKVKLERYSIKVDDTVINETIENLQRQYGEVQVAQKASDKDYVYGPLKSEDGSIEREIRIDLREVEKGFVKKFTSASVEDIIEFEPKKLYKSKHLLANQLGMTEEAFKKIKGKLTFRIQGIQHVNEAAVNQELFDKVFGQGAVNSLEEFKTKVKEAVSKTYVQEEMTYFQYKLREELVKQAKIELPDAFLKDWLKASSETMTDDILEKEYNQYGDELRWSLIRNKIIKAQNFEVKHEDVLEEAKNLIRKQFGGAGLHEAIESQLDTFANNYLQAEEGKNYQGVYNQVMQRRVMGHIESQITIKDKQVSLEAFRELD
jgi:trigger factor